MLSLLDVSDTSDCPIGGFILISTICPPVTRHIEYAGRSYHELQMAKNCSIKNVKEVTQQTRPKREKKELPPKKLKSQNATRTEVGSAVSVKSIVKHIKLERESLFDILEINDSTMENTSDNNTNLLLDSNRKYLLPQLERDLNRIKPLITITPDQIKKAHRKCVLKLHPDKVKNSNNRPVTPEEEKVQFLRLQEAHEVISNIRLRRLYISKYFLPNFYPRLHEIFSSDNLKKWLNEILDSLPKTDDISNINYQKTFFHFAYIILSINALFFDINGKVHSISDYLDPIEKYFNVENVEELIQPTENNGIPEFYDLLYTANSWSLSLLPDDFDDQVFDVDEATDRYERRYMLKENMRILKKNEGREHSRLLSVIDFFYQNDYRNSKQYLRNRANETKKQSNVDTSKNTPTINVVTTDEYQSLVKELFLKIVKYYKSQNKSNIDDIKLFFKSNFKSIDDLSKLNKLSKQFNMNEKAVIEQIEKFREMNKKVVDTSDQVTGGSTDVNNKKKWDSKCSIIFQKLMVKYPAGTVERWDVISKHMAKFGYAFTPSFLAEQAKGSKKSKK